MRPAVKPATASPVSETEAPAKNKNGQLMYRKGEETRRRLISATAELLKEKSFTELTVLEIARAAGSSKPNFYLYFDGVLDAVLAAAQDVSMATPELLALLNKNWPQRTLGACAAEFVTAYMQHWREHAHVLRVRVAMVANGDPRFWEAEIRATETLLLGLAHKIETLRGPGKDTVQCPHAMSTAGALLAMLERLASVQIDEALALGGITNQRVMQATAGMLVAAMRPPASPKSAAAKSAATGP